MWDSQTSLLFAPPNIKCQFEYQVFWDIINDRWSKYTVSWGRISTKSDIKSWTKTHLQEKYFTKATHNTYAYRILTDDNTIIEGKNDDGESWAGNCILRELQRSNIYNIIVVVTRYFGGVHLHADRFRNVIQASKIFIQKSQLS